MTAAKSELLRMFIETETETLSLEGRTLAAISSAWASYRDNSGIGSSEIIDGGDIHANGKFIGRMSYNGRVWPTRRWMPGDQPIYQP